VRRLSAAAAALTIVLLLYWGLRVYTPAISDDPKSPGAAIASLEQVDLGSSKQWILVRGKNVHAPIILFLHGGPGMPMMFLAHVFQAPLESHFLTVQWDRRGAGKSYSLNTDVSKMRLSQEIADTVSLIEKLRNRFGARKVILVGHSYGTTLGVLVAARRPDLIQAYVGVGQEACDHKTQKTLQDSWLAQEALRAHDTETFRQVTSGRPYDWESALFKYGGEILNKTSFLYLVEIGLRAPEYSLLDGFDVKAGVNFTHANMKNDVYGGALMDAVPTLAVPTYFLEGRRDYTSPFACAVRYLDRLKAPHKELIWFDHSAHFPFLEESERFATVLKRIDGETSHR